MEIREVMTRDPESIGPDTMPREAAKRMRDLDVGSLPVCGPNDKLVGMITDRDIVVKAVAGGRTPARLRDGHELVWESAEGFIGWMGRACDVADPTLSAHPGHCVGRKSMTPPLVFPPW